MNPVFNAIREMSIGWNVIFRRKGILGIARKHYALTVISQGETNCIYTPGGGSRYVCLGLSPLYTWSSPGVDNNSLNTDPIKSTSTGL